MANNYQPTITAGTDTNWVRAAQIVISTIFNPAAPATPIVSINIVEEQDFALAAGGFVTQPLPPGISYQEGDLSNTFNLLDANGNVTGTTTDAQLYQMLHSKYVALAQARDAANAAAQANPSSAGTGGIE